MTEEEKNERKEKAFEIVNEIKGTDNIFLPKNAELKGKLIAELKRIVPINIQEKVKKTLNRPILFVGDVCKSMLAGCYAHCVRKVEFTLALVPKRLDELSIKHFGNPVENIETARQVTKDVSKIEGKFIFKDCFGQPLEKLWHGDDPDYCHASILNPNRNVYTQNTGIKNWLEDYQLGRTLFLVCLEGKDSNECKEFVKNIREMSYPKPGIPNKLIVHTNDINKLPEYFSESFEIIKLGIPPVKSKSFAYNWSVIDNKKEIYSNGNCVAKLADIPYKLFNCLFKKRGKFAKKETLEKIWDEKPEYDKFLVDKMSELKTTLKDGLTKRGVGVQGEIIESKKNEKRKIIAYKLLT